jgi:translation initiation factor 3 subunit E
MELLQSEAKGAKKLHSHSVIFFLRPSTTSSSTSSSKMAEHDLSKTIIPYLDRHLAFPLLAHLAEINIFPVEDVQAAQYELAKGTNMVDYSENLFRAMNSSEDVPKGMLPSEKVSFKDSFHCIAQFWFDTLNRAEFDEKRQNAVSTNERLEQEAQVVLNVIENPDVAQALRQDKNQNLQYLKDNYKVRHL